MSVVSVGPYNMICRGEAKFTTGDVRISFARLAHFGPYTTLLKARSFGSIYWVTCNGDCGTQGVPSVSCRVCAIVPAL